MNTNNYDLENPPRLEEEVLYRGRKCEVQSVPSYALGKIRIIDPILGRVFVDIKELSRIDK